MLEVWQVSRQIVFIPVDPEDDNRIVAIYELSTSDRLSYYSWRDFVRYGHAECDIIVTTNDRLPTMRTRLKPYVGTYIEEMPR
jgi:hypothetical protein